jgi:hypothetical protein
MLKEEATLIAALEDGYILENNVITLENTLLVKLIITLVIAITIIKQCIGNVTESDNIRIVFIKLGGKLVCRSGY